MLREMDTDGDGRISKEEYVVFMSKSLEGSVAAARNLKDEVDAKLNQKAALEQAYESPSLRTRGGGCGASKALPSQKRASRTTATRRASTRSSYRAAASSTRPSSSSSGGGWRRAPTSYARRRRTRSGAPSRAAPAGPREGRAGRLLLGGGGEAARDERSTGHRRHAAVDRVCVARVGDVGPSGPARRQPPPPRRRDQEGADDAREDGRRQQQSCSPPPWRYSSTSALFQRDPTLFEASETPEAKEEGEERDAFIAALKAKTAFYGGEAYDKSRSEAEGRPFKAALDNMEVWYAHEGTTVVLLTETPEGSSALAYLLRGWPTFESSVAMLIKPYLGSYTWPSLIDVSLRASVCKRFAPLTPDGMHKLLMEKKFTNGADREVVVKLYTNVAERCIYPAEMPRLRWLRLWRRGDEGAVRVVAKVRGGGDAGPAEQRVHRDGLGPAGGGGGAGGRDAKAGW